MTDDRIAGAAQNFGGKVQSGVGRATGDAKMQVEGKFNEAAGAAQELYGQARTKVEDAADSAVETMSNMEDTIRDVIENRPYTAVAVAFAVGFIVSRLGRSS